MLTNTTDATNTDVITTDATNTDVITTDVVPTSNIAKALELKAKDEPYDHLSTLIKADLIKLAETVMEQRAKIDVVNLEYQDKLKILLGDKLPEYNAMVAEMDLDITETEEVIDDAESEIRSGVLLLGESVKTEYGSLSYTKGSKRVNSKAVANLATTFAGEIPDVGLTEQQVVAVVNKIVHLVEGCYKTGKPGTKINLKG